MMVPYKMVSADNIRIDLKQTWHEIVDCIHFPLDTDQWQASLKTAMNMDDS